MSRLGEASWGGCDEHRSLFVYFLLSLAIAFVIHVGSARAASDRMVITDLNSGAILSDQTLDEASETNSLSFDVGFAGVPVSAVFLLEPVGEPSDPTEGSPILLPGTDRVVSDVIAFRHNSIDPLAHSIVFLSDSAAPNIKEAIQSLLGLSYPGGSSAIDETCDLQDLTQLLGTAAIGWGVQVQSDVVPEPGTFLLLGAGLVGIAAKRRRWRS